MDSGYTSYLETTGCSHVLKEFTFLNIFYFETRDEEREKGLTCEKLQLGDLNVFWSIWDKAANCNEGWRNLSISPTKAHFSYLLQETSEME